MVMMAATAEPVFRLHSFAALPIPRSRIGSALSAAGLSALAAGLGGQRSVLREAAAFVRHVLATLASGSGGKLAIAREAPLLVRHARPALAGNGTLLLLIHRRKAAIGFLARHALLLVFGHPLVNPGRRTGVAGAVAFCMAAIRRGARPDASRRSWSE